jgi:hypothetical protein
VEGSTALPAIQRDAPSARIKATPKIAIPAKAGIHKFLTFPDSRWSLPRTLYGAGVTNWELLEAP